MCVAYHGMFIYFSISEAANCIRCSDCALLGPATYCLVIGFAWQHCRQRDRDHDGYSYAYIHVFSRRRSQLLFSGCCSSWAPCQLHSAACDHFSRSLPINNNFTCFWAVIRSAATPAVDCSIYESQHNTTAYWLEDMVLAGNGYTPSSCFQNAQASAGEWNFRFRPSPNVSRRSTVARISHLAFSFVQRSWHRLQRSTCHGEIKKSGVRDAFQRKVPLFWRYPNFLIIQSKEPLCQNQLSSISNLFERRPTCDRHRHTDSITRQQLIPRCSISSRG